MDRTYRQHSGELLQDGVVFCVGYSGHDYGRNNPDAQQIPNIGPIPCGVYKIGPAHDDPHLGPCVMHLDPTPETNTFGRTAFRIHGNDAQNDASHGCIILGPAYRRAIAKSPDRTLRVVP